MLEPLPISGLAMSAQISFLVWLPPPHNAMAHDPAMPTTASLSFKLTIPLWHAVQKELPQRMNQTKDEARDTGIIGFSSTTIQANQSPRMGPTR